MTNMSSDNSDLVASRAKGSLRQLFKSNRIGGDDADDFLIRPAATRNLHGFARTLERAELGEDKYAGNVARIGQDTPVSYFSMFTGVKGLNPNVPCVINGCTSSNTWPAGPEFWSPRVLVETLGAERRFEVAGADVTVALGEYVSYMGSTGAAVDDDPVYIFETLVDDDHMDIIDKFKVPGHFTSLTTNGMQHSALLYYCSYILIALSINGSERLNVLVFVNLLLLSVTALQYLIILVGCHVPIDQSDLLSVAGVYIFLSPY